MSAVVRASEEHQRRHRREMKHLQEELKEKNHPLSNSLVRLAFKRDPSLEDLHYLTDEF